MQSGKKMSCIRAWLDDRSKPYSVIDGTLRIRRGSSQMFIEFVDGEYLADGKLYRSQKVVINEVLNPFYGSPYKEV